MKILVDTHTHTVASSHAYSTVQENAAQAAAAGMEGIAITDHAPELTGGAHPWHFELLNILPREISGVKILYGAEINLLDADGAVDLPPSTLSKLDVVIASMHHETFPPQDRKAHTHAYLKALKNPYIDIIGHSGSPEYIYDIDTVLAAAKREGKMIEINNQSHLVRKGNVENCLAIAKKCMEMEVYVAVGSDAHFSGYVGNFNEAIGMLNSIGFPEELVANLNFKKFVGILRQRKLVGGV